MGPFQLDIFCDSVILQYMYVKLKNIRAHEKNKLSAYFSMNNSSNQSFLTCTRKSQHRETKTNRNKWIHGECCLSKLNRWLCIQSSISKDSVPYASTGVERNTTEGNVLMFQRKKDQKNHCKGKNSYSKLSSPFVM